MPKIVFAGQDIRLLETRAEVLKMTGAEVSCCFGEQAFDIVRLVEPDLLVMCHTIAHKDAEAIADRVHAFCPKARVLLVLSQIIDDRPEGNGRFDGTSEPDPARLVARSAELLSWLTQYRVKEITRGRQVSLVV
jgi:hypothetical protein